MDELATDDPTKPGNPIEALLMQQANEAIRRGKDPKAVTEHLGVLARHLRSNPRVRDQANAALTAGKDPSSISQHLASLASAGPTGNITLGEDAPAAHAAQPSAPSAAESALSGAAQGSTFGFADEVLGGIGAANALLPKAIGGEGASLSDVPAAYRRDRDKVRNFDSAASDAHGKAHLAGGLAGGLLPIVTSGGASAASGLGNVLKQGALYGALQGAGAAKSFTDIPEDAAIGGGVGALGGTVLHGLGKGAAAMANKSGVSNAVSKGAGALAEKVAPDGKIAELLHAIEQSVGDKGAANRTINQGLQREGNTPQGVLTKLEQNVATSGDKPELLGDYSPETLRTTKSLTKAPGSARSKIVQAITDRNAGTRERVIADLGGGAPPPNVRPQLESMTRDRAASAKQLSQHFAGQAIDSPAVNEILQRPTFKDIFGDAQRLAADEGRTLPTRTTHTMAPEAQALYDAAQPGDQPGLLQKLLASGAATPSEVPAPDVESLAYLERSLDDRIRSGFNGSKSVGKNQAAALREGFKTIRSEVSDQSPEYAAFLKDYATRSAPIKAGTRGLNLSKYTGPLSSAVADEAMGAGDPLALKALNTGLPGLERAVSKMGPDSQSLFRAGAKTHVTDVLNSVPADLDGSTTGVLRNRAVQESPASERIRSLLFGDQASDDAFTSALGRERGMAASSAKLKGSDTAENLSDQEARKVTSLLSHLLHPVRGLKAASSAIDKAATDRANTALGEQLGGTGADHLRQVLADLLQSEVGAAGQRQVGNAIRNTAIPHLPFVGASD